MTLINPTRCKTDQITMKQQQEALHEVLSSTLPRVIEFLKFAETKNAALLTFASAWILASVNLLTREHALPEGLASALAVALPLFIASAVVAFFRNASLRCSI